ncbi:hypothetical protein Daus18300_008381 [Diaporthe australafricana]|uniref:Uncharacterized protein n=1 Tax=Diaporthe australafricana TaxID=127596 RepID=A0ABR3WIQ9_9PEZI
MASRSACAITLLCSIFATTPGTFALTFIHMHQAFWCCVVDVAIQWPIDVVIYYSKRHLTPGTHRRLVPIINFLWSDVLFRDVARWVQLFVVHASLSPFLSDASESLEPSRLVTYGGLLQAVAYLCIILIVHDVMDVLEVLQALCNEAVDCVMEIIKDEDDLPPDIAMVDYGMPEMLMHAFDKLMYAFFAGLSWAHGCLAQLFVNMALYLERMAAGTVMKALQNAGNTLPRWQFCVFATVAGLFVTMVLQYAMRLQEEHAQQPWNLHRRPSDLRQTIPAAIETRLYHRTLFGTERNLRSLVSRNLHWIWPWFQPEFAALLPEDELWHLYARALTHAPPLMVAASWNHRALREHHVELWRRTGLPTGLVLKDEIGAPLQSLSGGDSLPGQMRFLFMGRITAAFVRLLEIALGVYIAIDLLYPQ